SLSARLRLLSAAVTRSFNPLNSGPCVLRSSGAMVPSVARRAETVPLRPSAATRTVSSDVSLPAPAISVRIWFWSACRSDIGDPRKAVVFGPLGEDQQAQPSAAGLIAPIATASEGRDGESC